MYSFVLGWREEPEQGSDSIKNSTIQETKSVQSYAVTIPRGKSLKITQVAEICGVKKRTVYAWLKEGQLNGLHLPGLGELVEEKNLEQYLKEKRNRS